jgi:hypothetical protein
VVKNQPIAGVEEEPALEKPMSSAREDFVGRKYAKLTALSFSHCDRSGHSYWLCQCDCGSAPRPCGGFHLKRGKVKSCGCVPAGHKHGGRHTLAYQSWISMKARCLNPRLPCYERYGGRGITICDRWLKGDGTLTPFECFVADLGERKSFKYSLDRIDVDGNYEPSNCRWATASQQMRNTRRSRVRTYKGHRASLPEIVEKFANVGSATVDQRLFRGWPLEKALELPHLPKGQALKRL